MGIGKDGKSLKQQLDENRRLYNETGRYAGIEKLSLRQRDPMKYELFHSRIISALIAGRETTRMISASPMVREVAELCIGLYTPEGENIAQSTGIQVHIQCMGEVIQWMIDNNYEEEVGIADGDLFCSNDNAIAGLHPADVYDILPVFWEGELISWVCTVIMEPDIGAVTPSCMPVPNVERATDGIRICAEKIGSEDKIRRDFEVRIERTINLASVFLIDRRGAIAANIQVREEMRNLIREFGYDYYTRAIRELIEEERRNQIARIRQRAVPGRYRNVACLEIYMKDQPVSWLPAKKDTIRLIPINMEIKPSGTMVLDFEGAGEWGWHCFNSSPSGMSGGLSISMVQTLCYDGRANLGSLLPTKVITPPDSVLNPSRIVELPTALVWMSTIHTFGLWYGLMSIAYYARGFREEIIASMPGGGGLQCGGYNQYGIKSSVLPVQQAGFQGGGARGIMDGVDNGGQVYTPEPDIGNCEVWEMFYPYLVLAARYNPYSVGYGRFRSGVSMSGTIMIHNSGELVASSCTTIGASAILINNGLFGGYPAPRLRNIAILNNNSDDLIIQRKPLIYEIGDPSKPNWEGRIEGDIRVYGHLMPVYMVRNGDIFVSSLPSAGGLGDPIEREPSSVKRDLEKGLTTQEIAREIYGAEANYNASDKEWRIDLVKTNDLRAEKKKQRLSRAMPVKEWWKTARKRLMSGAVNPMLKEMYRSSMKLSRPFAQEFMEFWALPNDFDL